MSSALTLSGSNLYIAVASHCDRGPYKGRLIRVNTTTRATNAFYFNGGPTGPDGGGVWGWGGASIDPSNGDAYVATGNVFANPENSFYGDAIVRLTGSLGFVASHSPGVGIGDDDFGSTPVLFQKPGCPPQLLAEQKSGDLYLYDRGSIAGGFRQQVRITQRGTSSACLRTLPRLRWCTSSIPSPTGSSERGCSHFASTPTAPSSWRGKPGQWSEYGSTPTVANGVVYYGDGFGPRVHAVNATTGQALWSSGAELTRAVFAAPVVANGQLYVAAWDHKLHAYGLP